MNQANAKPQGVNAAPKGISQKLGKRVAAFVADVAANKILQNPSTEVEYAYCRAVPGIEGGVFEDNHILCSVKFNKGLTIYFKASIQLSEALSLIA